MKSEEEIRETLEDYKKETWEESRIFEGWVEALEYVLEIPPTRVRFLPLPHERTEKKRPIEVHASINYDKPKKEKRI